MSFIIGKLTKLNKRVLVSATSDIEIPKYTRVVNPTILGLLFQKMNKKPIFRQNWLFLRKEIRWEFVYSICSVEITSRQIVFCNHRDAAERISDTLNEKASILLILAWNGSRRESALIQFRNEVSYLITTDLAGQVSDIPEMNHVIHYHLPSKRMSSHIETVEQHACC
jgi:superfamily II DNA/RNA helicase